MRYRLIGIDLDGTLLNRRGHVSAANRAALARARQRGVITVPCTGRSWRESRRMLAELDHDGPGVFVTGAAISHVRTGQTLHAAAMAPDLAWRVVQLLAEGPEAVLVFRDSARVGHDYLVTGGGRLTANTRWWFEVTAVNVHFQAEVAAADLHDTLRIGIVASPPGVEAAGRAIREALGSAVFVQHFAAVTRPDNLGSVHVLEVFNAGVNKWRGLAWIARHHAIAPQQIAVIGDEVNDLDMMAQAGCCIAMGNAIEQVKDRAHHVTHDCDADGVAHAIDRLLAGDWC